MKKSKLSRRITWRVIAIMSFFNVLIIGAMFWSVFRISLVNSNMRGQYVVDGIVGKIESMLWAVHISSANNRDEVERNLGSPEQVFDALEREISVNQLLGCFAAFEPDYFKGQGRWFEAYVYRADSSRYDRQQIGSPSHDYFNGPWYKKGLSRDRKDLGYLTSPYFDNSVDSSMYCSYVLPIFDRQGRKVGVYGVDLNYLWINKVIAEVEKIIKREFFDTDESIQDRDGVINFSVQFIDSKGNRVLGSDSLDINILKAEQEQVFSNLGMRDLKGTPYYVNYKPLPYTDWTVSVIQHRDLVFTWGGVLSFFIAFCMVVGSLVILFFTSWSIRRATKPLGFLSDSAQEVAKGNFDAPLPTFRHNDEVAQLRDSFGTMQQSLKQYMEDLKASTTAKAALESELNIARDIQLSKVPTEFPQRPDFDIYASMTPAKAVGGDLYDFFVRDNELLFCLGDVCGKGVPAALFMMETRSLFRAYAADEDRPDRIVLKMNKTLNEHNESLMFVTLFVGILDLTTGELRYCNAGHETPLVINKEFKQLPFEGVCPVGVVADPPYVMQTVHIEPQTTILVYTDGLDEAMTADKEKIGNERIFNEVSCAIQNGQTGPKELIERLKQAVHDFVGDAEQSDDLTLLAIRFGK
jgi:sigma-B regulation protein RsbU (phosphoserine phosphatase)